MRHFILVVIAALGSASCALTSTHPLATHAPAEARDKDCALYIDRSQGLLLAELEKEIDQSADVDGRVRARIKARALGEAKRQLDARRGRAIQQCDEKVSQAVYHCVIAAQDLDEFGQCDPPELEIAALPGVDCEALYRHERLLARRYVDGLGMTGNERESAYTKMEQLLNERRQALMNECVTIFDRQRYECYMAASDASQTQRCDPGE